MVTAKLSLIEHEVLSTVVYSIYLDICLYFPNFLL
jgi:hypothetical protein